MNRCPLRPLLDAPIPDILLVVPFTAIWAAYTLAEYVYTRNMTPRQRRDYFRR